MSVVRPLMVQEKLCDPQIGIRRHHDVVRGDLTLALTLIGETEQHFLAGLARRQGPGARRIAPRRCGVPPSW